LRNAWRRGLRIAFAAAVAQPVVRFWLGLNVRHRERLPLRGPAIVAANHNSHLDICTLLSLFPLSRVPDVQPAAAADYFMKGGPLSWVAQNLVGIIPVVRGGIKDADGNTADPLEGCYQALAAGKILVIFPEGTRGEPERMQALKSGISYLARRFPDVPVVPLYMYGLGKSMPKGAWFPLPFFVDIFVGRPLTWRGDSAGDKAAFMEQLNARFVSLRAKARPLRDAGAASDSSGDDA
jgi:1-acyl-sn-glycerol-3-phosphate acyltransferase